MAKHTAARFLTLLASAAMSAALVSPVSAETASDTKADTSVPRNKLHYDEPSSLTPISGSATESNIWQQETLPIGNSYMGANIYGEYDKERLTLNSKSLWNGGPSASRPNYNGGNKTSVNGTPMAEYVQNVVKAYLTGQPDAVNLTGNIVGMGQNDGYGAYQGLGDLYLDFDRSDDSAWERYWTQFWSSGTTKIDDRDSSIVYSGFSNWDKPDWYQGTEKYTYTVGAELTLTFTGRAIRMIGARNDECGSLDVYLDGELKLEDQVMTSSTAAEGQTLFELTGLENTVHTLRVVNKGGSKNKVTYDYFEVKSGATVTETVVDLNPNNASSTGVQYSSDWQTYNRAANNEDDAAEWVNQEEMYVDSSSSNTYVTYTFTGTGITLFGAKNGNSNANMGSFTWSVDGSKPEEVNCVRDETTLKRMELFSKKDLSDGEHTVTIRGVSKKLSIDNFVVYSAGDDAADPPVPEKPEEHTDATNYKRWLDLDNALAGVEYDRDNTHYTREYLASYPDNVIAIRMTAEGAKTLDFDLTLPLSERNSSTTGKTATVTAAQDGTLNISGSMNDNQLKFAANVKVITDEAGTVTPGYEVLEVRNAKEAVVFFCATTDYDDNYPVYRTGESDEQVAARAAKAVSAAQNKGYAAVRSSHVSDYKNIYDRLTINLGQTLPDKTTDALLAGYKNDSLPESERRYLETELYQYGRYLQIASSREGDRLPANLQGVWSIYAGGLGNIPWGADYHMNVNLQMNYWPTYSANMAECALPMIRYEDRLREPGRVTATTYYGIDNSNGQHNGYSAHTQNNPFGWTCPGWEFSWGWSPTAVPWMLQNVYEYYEYTGDVDYLKNTIFPMMEEEARLFEQVLHEVTYDNGKTRLATVPAYSPEHGPFTAGNVYDNTLLWQLYNDCLEAADVLNEKYPGTVSEDKITLWTDIKEKLDPIEIGDSGQIKEWFDETTLGSLGNREHRHMSHLLGLFPGDLITIDNQQWMDAARVSLLERADTSTGWGMGQRINAWARMKDGDHCMILIKNLFKNGIYNNLWDAHPPFQIDGNFGYTSGVNEMLMQSNAGSIEILPALPSDWADGSISGIVARGNFELSESWRAGTIDTVDVLSRNGGTCTITSKDLSSPSVVDEDGNEVKVTPSDDKLSTFSFETEKGKSYTVKQSAETAEKTIVSAAALDVVSVNFNTAAADLGLPAQASAVLSDGTSRALPVIWNTADYQKDKAGDQILKGTFTLPDGISNPDGVQPSITVHVNAPVNTLDNLALNRTVSSSGVEATTNYTPEGAVDGNKTDINSRWSSARMKSGMTAGQEQTEQWYQIDLGRECEIHQIVTSFYLKCYGQDYEIQVSDDGQTWKTIGQNLGRPANASLLDPVDTLDLSEPVNARYVKFVYHKMNDFAGGSSISVREYEVFGKEAAVPAPTVDTSLLELAINKTEGLPLSEFDAKQSGLSTPLSLAKEALKSTAQSEIDDAAKALHAALLDQRRLPSSEALNAF